MANENGSCDYVPSIILIISGKRKSGKDYTSSILWSMIGEENCFMFHISHPIKEHFAKTFNLDLSQLLGSSSYKEIYRKQMVEWGVQQRNADPGLFCRLASRRPENEKPVWMLTDARRQTDVDYFVTEFGKDRVLTIRVVADGSVRKSRGWQFTEGIDDSDSECGLDGYNHDVIIENNGTNEDLIKKCKKVVDSYIAHFIER